MLSWPVIGIKTLRDTPSACRRSLVVFGQTGTLDHRGYRRALVFIMTDVVNEYTDERVRSSPFLPRPIFLLCPGRVATSSSHPPSGGDAFKPGVDTSDAFAAFTAGMWVIVGSLWHPPRPFLDVAIFHRNGR